MNPIGAIYRFELGYHLRQPFFYIVFAVFFLMAFLATASETLTVGGGTGNINFNAPFAIMQTQLTFTTIGVFIAIAFVASPVVRDTEQRMAELFFTTSVTPQAYLWGRFAGAFTAAYLAFLGAPIGEMFGAFMPWLDPERRGPFPGDAYVFSAVAMALPTLFIMSSLFFYLATLFRSMMAAYVGAVAVVSAFIVLSLVTDQERLEDFAFLDPFGANAFGVTTRYWTVFDKNSALIPFDSLFFQSRIVWLVVAGVALWATHRQFTFSLEPPQAQVRVRALIARFRRPKAGEVPDAATTSAELGALRAAPGRVSRWAQFSAQARLEAWQIVRSPAFAVLLILGMVNVLGFFIGAANQIFGTTVLPVPRIMVGGISAAFTVMVLIVVAYYTAELVHRERSARMSEMLDALPHPIWTTMLAKYAGLALVIFAMFGVAVIMAITVQLAYGYTRIEPGVYLVGVFVVQAIPMVLLAGIGLFLQIATYHRYAGMLALVAVFIGMQSLAGFGYEHRLYIFPLGSLPYSDMNGWGHFLKPALTFGAYWAGLVCLLLILAYAAWPRGTAVSWRDRIANVGERLPGRTAAAASAVLVATVVMGAWIFYNTNVVNEYRTSEDLEAAQAEYEKRFRQYRDVRFPDVSDVEFNVDIYPGERRLESRGTYTLENTAQEPIDELHLTVPYLLTINSIELDGGELVESDEFYGYYKYRIEPALEPGATTTLTFDLSWLNPGFKNAGDTTRVVGNGTFVNNTEIAPLIGYQAQFELNDNNDRRKYDLPPVERFPDLDDSAWYGQNQLGARQRVDFRATVSTADSQIAIAPGYLEREWTEDGRRFFSYRMDEAIWGFFAFMSAEYEVVRDTWNEEVAIEVFHHPEHAYNVQRMIDSTKKSLDYFSTEFSPYRYRQFRIFEFPAYAAFAQAFPNTIPYSEGIGFIADLRDEEDIDYVFYVTAHELAHQWWAHQVVGASVQGATAITETLAQYSALMVMEREYGRDQMKRFLRYELDSYLAGRGGELIEELPLLRVENQPYVHYRKGSLVMYALKDYLGEAAVNRALRRLIGDWGMKDHEFPTTRHLVDALRAEAGPQHHDLIADLFERITLFDLKTTSATAVAREDGRFDVTLALDAAKFTADGSGAETETPFEMTVDIGVFAETGDGEPDVLYMAKHVVASGTNEITVTVDSMPLRAGVDPYNIHVDRVPDDNETDVSVL